METEAKSSKGNKSSFKHAGKQSVGSDPNQPARSQPACQEPTSLPGRAPSLPPLRLTLAARTGRAERDRGRTREGQREEERGSFHYTKTLLLLLLPPFALVFIPAQREMLWVKVTDADNCISQADGTITLDRNIVTDSDVFAGGDAKRPPSPLCVVCMCV